MSDFSKQMYEWPFDSSEERSIKRMSEKFLKSTFGHEEDEQFANLIRNAQIQSREEAERQISNQGSKIPILDKKQILQNTLNQVRKYAKFIKKEKNQKKSQKKNTNFSKFIAKSFFRQVKNIIPLNQEDQEWILFNNRLRLEIFKKGSNNITRSALYKLFSSGIQEQNFFQRKNRKFILQIMQSPQFILQNIIKNQYMKHDKNKIQYLIASKVFKLRCCSKSLITRHETR